MLLVLNATSDIVRANVNVDINVGASAYGRRALLDDAGLGTSSHKHACNINIEITLGM